MTNLLGRRARGQYEAPNPAHQPALRQSEKNNPWVWASVEGEIVAVFLTYVWILDEDGIVAKCPPDRLQVLGMPYTGPTRPIR